MGEVESVVGASFARYAQTLSTSFLSLTLAAPYQNSLETQSVAGFGEIAWAGCTILRHGAVNGVHSIEKACSYKGVIFVDVENRKSKNRIVL